MLLSLGRWIGALLPKQSRTEADGIAGTRAQMRTDSGLEGSALDGWREKLEIVPIFQVAQFYRPFERSRFWVRAGLSHRSFPRASNLDASQAYGRGSIFEITFLGTS